MHGAGGLGGEGARAAACRALEFPGARRRRSPLLSSSLQGFLMKLYMMIEGFCCEKYR